MDVKKTDIEGLVIIKPKVYKDNRGYFFESFSQKEFENKVCKTVFVQDNESSSKYGVLRGLHYQKPPFAQAKLIRVIRGKVLDIAVDLRHKSSTFGKYVSVELSDDNKLQTFIPRGFAHGFIVLSDYAVCQYKCDNFYAPEHAEGIKWDDKQLNIDWLLPKEDIILSEKDKNNQLMDFNSIYFDE
ncbi:MAG: dTDP-4-dehydrorhamnose 3,5-epimerase [Bacteroidales bacterium]|nr:dTDP-4-dehydrorhamnose 3,5-epimerase [Bacteroidales bacterium]